MVLGQLLLNTEPLNSGTEVTPPVVSTLRLVNTAPGDSLAHLKPEQPVQFGLRSTTQSIDPASLKVFMGLTHILNEGLLPETDANLKALGVDVQVQTSERRLPVTGQATRAMSGSELRVTKTSTSMSELGIYELKFPIQPGASIIGYFKVRVQPSWGLTTPDWVNLNRMIGMYFGLEHGSFNTAAYTFLRSPTFGHGSLVVGGPLQVFSTPRPAQQELTAFDWTPGTSQVLEIWIYFNAIGYPPPFASPYVPVLEVWGMRDGTDLAPVVLTQIPVGALGTFQAPASNFSNYRFGPTDFATLYFGNAGTTGDVLELLDWALCPNFQMTTNLGQAMPNSSLVKIPDTPTRYTSREALDPRDLSMKRWFALPGVGFHNPSTSFVFQTGRKKTPRSLRLSKVEGVASGFKRTEPRLEEQTEGATIEALMSGIQTARVGDVFGAGLSIEDGTVMYRAVLLQSEVVSTIGISKTTGSDLTDFHIPMSGGQPLPIDWSNPKLVRLILDRVRSKVALVVDEVRVLEIPLSDPFPDSITSHGRMSFGHFFPIDSVGTMDVSMVGYTSRYKAWEVIDQVVPGTTPPYILQANGLGATSLDVPAPDATTAVISKSVFGTDGTHRFYKLAEDVSETKGVQVDFEVVVLSYTDGNSNPFAALTWVGAGIQIFLGNKVLHLGFFDAGLSGRVLGIIPGSGSVNDILNQTTLGREFSAPIDWTQDNTYRLVMSGYDSIQVWASSVSKDPIITIPWRGDSTGFDLPTDNTAPAVAFGHFDGVSSSVTAWKAVRHSVSNGYDIAVQQKFPDGQPPVLFGGKELVRVEFDEL